MVLHILFDYIKKHKILTFLVILSVIGVTVFALIPAQILRIIVDDYINLSDESLMIRMAFIYTLSYVLVGSSTFLKDYILIYFSQNFLAFLKDKMIRHYTHLKYNMLIDNNIGGYETYFNTDVETLNELFTSGVIDMLTDSIKIIGILISLFIYSYKFALIVLGILPIVILFTIFVQKRMLKAEMKTKRTESVSNQILLQNVENISTLKIYHALDYAKNKYNETLENHYKASLSSSYYDAIFSPVMQILRSTMICLILLLSGIKPDLFNMSLGMIVSAISLISDLFSPIEGLGTEIQTIQKSIASYKRLNEFFSLECEDEKNSVTPKDDMIVINNLTFAYDKIKVIDNYSMIINSGDKIVLKGVSGRGKSTLMKLIMGILKPVEGSVRIGGVDSYLLSDEVKNEYFSIVYQDPFFSGGSIYEEISLKDCNIKKEKVKEALNMVGLDYINDLDIILDPANYSSGELQLFNLARIVVKRSKIIFLDEMNSSIDSITSKNIIELIDRLFKDKTIISINHYGDIIKGAKIINL